MKKFAYSFIIALFICLNCFGNNPNSSYENHKLLDSVIVYNYLDGDSVKVEKHLFINENDIELAIKIEYAWDAVLNDWVCLKPALKDYCKYEYGNVEHAILIENIYFESGKQTRLYYSMIDESWILTGKVECNFDAKGNQTLDASYIWDSELEKWNGDVSKIPYGKVEKSYDEAGNVTLIINYDWNSATNDWIVASRHEYKFDVNGNQTLRALYIGNKGSYKYEYEYDSSGNQTLLIYYNWNSELNDWIETEKREWKYDEVGNQILDAFYKWNLNVNDWIAIREHIYKHTYNYDEAGNIILDLKYYWDSDLNVWNQISKNKFEYEYDTGGNITLEASYRWDSDLNNWKMYSKHKYEHEFDSNGIKTYEASFEWDSDLNDWKLISKYKFKNTYDTAGNQTFFACLKWHKDLNDWVFVQKEVWDYDADGNQILYAKYDWNSAINNFLGLEKSVWNYDASGKIVLQATYKWNTRHNDWIGERKYEYEYDYSGNCTLKIHYEWDSIVNDWVCISPDIKVQNKYRYGNFERTLLVESLYDEFEKLILELHYSLISDNWILTTIHKPVFNEMGDRVVDIVYAWNKGVNEWLLCSKFFYYYTNPSTGIHQLANEDIILYPNPTSGILHISGINHSVDINIYNISGHLIKSFQKVNNTINISAFKTGIYVLRLLSDNEIVVRKIVKE